ncbi:PP2C family serine/threonine-protein phosphatase [Cupriavidus sp. WS]|uniref:PP2C family serine/threonine-protein phosphatase n=1 Tax=Cupriavidus sp. WS TaxID=1312922 RepID=UPI0009DBAE89
MGSGVTWNVISASTIGTAHVANGGHCQDTCFADVVTGADGAPHLVCLVSDGAGSAQFAAQGAELACSTAIAGIETTLSRGGNIARADIAEWVVAIQEAIRNAASSQGHTSRDYACTLVGAVVGTQSAAFFQIGDGAIVVSNPSVQGVVFWPEPGAYANMTHFVTDDDALGHLCMAIVPVNVEEIGVFSDGLQRLALAFDAKLPHHPFFDPMFNVLRSKKQDECEALSVQLSQFLDSKQVNERTDDDKSLILATRRTA